MRFLRLLLGLALLPFCAAATATVVSLVRSIQPPSYTAVPLSAWGLLIGFIAWIILFFALPRPVRAYVLAHELTHALWGWAMGAEVRGMRVSGKGGSVTVSKSNFLIALAPYFFPLYTVIAILVYLALSAFFDLHTYEPFWLGLVGLTYAFHLTFTVTMLLQHQPDVRENGRVFSLALIYLLNVLGIGLWIVSVASPTLQGFADRLAADVAGSWRACGLAALAAWGFLRDTVFPMIGKTAA